MGMCSSCLKGSSNDFTTPDMETKRRQQAEAAEKRLREQESRGIKDPDRLKRQQQRNQELERRQEAVSRGGEAGLKWQVG